jgi:acetyl-CoA carboxylase biotin carboxyl carrier protein
MVQMISIDDLDRLLGWMLKDQLQLLEVSEGNARIRLRMADGRSGMPGQRVKAKVLARGLGRFVPAHPRSGEPALKVGDHVDAGGIVGFIQNDAMLLPIVSGQAGDVREVHVAAGSLLGFGAPVLTLMVEPEP